MAMKWVCSQWEGVTYVWEVGDDGWVQRSVELAGPKRRVQAAAALAEVIRARDAGGIEAVQAYEAQYGVLPEKPIDDLGFPHEDITQSDFERLWAESRRALGA